MRGINVKDVKETNKALLYECVRRNGQTTLAALEQMTNLSRPTVTGLVRELEEEGRLLRIGCDYSNVGRAPVLYGINPNAFYAIGIDFDFPVCRMAIGNLNAEKIASSRRVYPMQAAAREAVDMLVDQAEATIAQSGIQREKLLGIGIGMPGVIDARHRRSIVFERIPDWKDFEVGDLLQQRLGLPVYMENDVHALTWAERKLWSPKEFSNMLFIAIRSGIGMCVIMNGKSLSGENGNAGFLGHTVVNTDGLQCTCGKRGCLELYNSEPSMLKMYHSWTGEKAASMDELVASASAGNIAACRVLEYAGYFLGIGIGNAALLFDISRVVVNAQFDIGMMLGRAQETLNDNINRYRNVGKIKLFTGRLEEPDYALGGCLMAFEAAGVHSKPQLVP